MVGAVTTTSSRTAKEGHSVSSTSTIESPSGAVRKRSGRHPGGRPRRGPAHPRDRGRGRGDLRGAERDLRVGAVHHVPAPRRARTQRPRRAGRAPASTSAAPCSRCTPRATTATRRWLAWPGPMLEAVGEDTGETVHLAVANGGRVAHVAQVDSTFLLGARDWTDVDVPPHCSALGKVLLAWKVLDLPEGPLERCHRPELPHHRGPGGGPRGGPLAEASRSPSTSSRSGSPVWLRPSSGRREPSWRVVGISGPTARLEDRVDHLGQLLKEQTEALSKLLRHGTRTEGKT